MSKWDRPKSHKEKLQFIQSILNGNFEQLAEPNYYQVMHFENEGEVSFTVSCKSNPQWSKIMNRDEYEQWHSTLKDNDTVFIIKFQEYRTTGNEPLKDESQIQAEYEAERKQRIETHAKETKARKSQKKEPTKEIEVLKIDDNYFPLQPIVPNHGKISEYGQTWKLRNN